MTFRMPIRGASWTEEHRPVLFVVLVITVIMFVLGGGHVVSSIRAPFSTPTGKYRSLSQLEDEERAAQKNRDTDGDQLSDYDELQIYQTSPYLNDTDSDGDRDGDEVRAGEDPNCPKGNTCGPAATLLGPGVQASDLTNTPGGAALSASGGVPTSFVGLTPELLQNMTPTELRQLLRGTGVSEEILSKFSDEQLLSLYNETLAEHNPLGTTEAPPTSP